MSAYATLDDLSRYLGMGDDHPPPNAFHTVLLSQALDNASAIIDTQTHRTYAAPADAVRTFDPFWDVQGGVLWLGADLCALSEVTNGDGSAIELAQLQTQPRYELPYYALSFRRNSGGSWQGEDEIAVTGRWAYSMTPPDAIVQATLRLASWLYRQRDNANELDRTVIVGAGVILPAKLPADVDLILAPFKRVVP